MKIALRLSIFVLASFALLGMVALAQNTTATVTGVVTDPQGSVVPDAQVLLTNHETNVVSSTKSNGAGLYRIAGLLPGTYRVDATHSGFKGFVEDGIQLHVGDQVSVNFNLQVGEITQTVTVQGGAPLLQTEDATVAHVISARTIEDQPLNGRNIYDLVALAPGVIAQGGSGQQAAMSQIWASNNYQIGGGFGNQSSTFLDGAPLNISYAYGTPVTPTQDSVAEFRIETNNVGPEYGATAGGIVSMVTRTGTDTFHGTAYEFLRNKVLNANTYFGSQAGLGVPAFTQNQYGASLGGPIVKGKAFFFFSWESFALRQGVTNITTLPTAQERAGNFSADSPIYDPCAGNVNEQNTCSSTPAQRTQFAGNQIPANRLDPTAVAIMNATFPLPNAPGVNNFIDIYSTGENSRQFTARIDDDISSSQHIFGRYTYSKGVLGQVLYLGTPYFGTAPSPTTVNQAVIGDDYVINNSTVANLNVSYLRFNWVSQSNLNNVDLTKFAWPASFNSEMTWPQPPAVNIDGYTGTYGQGLIATNNNYALSGSITKVAGRHTLRFGANGERLDDNYGQTGTSGGEFDFSTGITALDPENPGNTGNAFASFLLGYAEDGDATQLNIPAPTYYYYGVYANDQYKVTPKLTLNLGIRWEQPGAYSERHNRATVFLPGQASPLAAATGLQLKGDLTLVDSPEWTDRHNMSEHWDLFAPRLGFSYQLANNTVARGGFGIFLPPTGTNLYLTPAQSPVAAATTTYVASLDGGITPNATLHNPFPTGIVQPSGRDPNFETDVYGSSFNSPVPVQPAARVYQWNLGMQRDLGRGVVFDMTYAGARGTNMPVLTENINTLPDADRALGSQLLQTVPSPFFGNPAAGPVLASQQIITNYQLLLPYPQFGTVGAVQKDDRDTYYNALQTTVRKRFANGGNVAVAYTWAKLMSNTDTMTTWSENQAGFQGPRSDQDPNNLRGEVSLSSDDVRQNLVINYVYDLPFGRGQRWAGTVTGLKSQVISGWELDGVTSFRAGFPLGIHNGNAATLAGNRPNVVPGCQKRISGSALSRINKWFNTACFTNPPAFTFGNESREDSTLRAQGVNNWNLGLAKRFTLHKEDTLTFRTEIFNLFNDVQFGPPGTGAGNSQFGVIGSQVNDPRLLQFALRLNF